MAKKIIDMRKWLEAEAEKREKEVMEDELDIYQSMLDELVCMSPVLVRRLVSFCNEHILGEKPIRFDSD